MIRYAKLNLPLNLREMQQELLLMQDGWQRHFNTIYYEGNWNVLSLRSSGGSCKNIIPDLIAGGEYLDTEIMSFFPSVKLLLASIKCPVMSVRFLNLQAGAIIKPHTDKELCFEKGEARLHFPLKTNPMVGFYIEDERIRLNEGECWYINANLMHSVFNRGNADRIHLVIDCRVNDWLSGVIESAENKSIKVCSEDEQLPMIINELRLQNTESSNQLAQQLELQHHKITA